MSTAKLKVESWWDEETKVDSPNLETEVPKKSYSNRLVAWIDILGMRNMIKDESNEADTIFGVMEKLRSFVQTPCASLAKEGKVHYTQIADGFMIVADIECANDFCSILADVQWRVLVECQMLLRGAVTAGKVSVSDDPQIIIGPAYVDAYMLESENAIYPRVILTDEFFSATKGHLNFPYIATDADKERYLDFLPYAIQKNNLDPKRVEHLLETQGVFKVLKDTIKKANKAKSSGRSVSQKHGWTVSKLEMHKIKVR
jgi:hypothetical protein